MITIIIGNTKCRLNNLLDQKVMKAIDLELSYDVQGFKFMKIGNNWDGKHRLLTKSNYFPIGMISKVKAILSLHGCKYKVIDNRIPPVYGKPISPIKNSNFKDRKYQGDAIKKCIKSGSGIVRMATGSGKSYVIAALVANYNTKSIIYVVSIDLLYQMVDTLKKSFGIEAGMIGDGHCDIKQVNVMTIWSAGAAFGKKLDRSLAEDFKPSRKKGSNREKIIDLVRTANLIVLDECQYAGSDTFQFISRESASAHNRFLFSGTPWRESGDDILLESVGGPKIVDISASFLIEKGFLVRPKIFFRDVPIIRGVGKTYQEVYSNYIVNNDARNSICISLCKKMLKRDVKTLVLIRNINHGKIISEKLDAEGIEHIFLNGKDKSKDREDGINKVRSGEIKVIVASTIFDIGIDIPSLGALINMGGGKSTGKMLQRIGRVIRGHKGKTQAYIFDFYDQCKFLRDHSQSRFKISCSEPKFSVKRIKAE